MIKVKLLLFLLIINLASCQKNKTTNNKNDMGNKTFYFIDYNYNKKCGFAIYINDILVEKAIKPVNLDYAITPINSYILESGIQDIKVVLFPFNDNETIDVDADFQLKVFYIEDYNQEVISSIENIAFDLPDISILDEKLPKWEYKNVFKTKIPYKVKGWKNSKKMNDVSNIDYKIKDKFSQLKLFLENKQVDKFLKELSVSMDESTIFYYLTKDQSYESINDMKEFIKTPNIKVASLDGTIVRYYANGKLATLETKEGKPAIRIIEKSDGYVGEESFPILLHIPQDSDNLEVIR